MGTSASGYPGAQPDVSFERRLENLALAFQEVYTAIVRLRSNRQAVTESESFRAQMREALKRAEEEARRQGYSSEETRLAVFALVGFLDESILNLQLPVFANWPRKPLEEELFGVHIAGEIFFQNIQRLLGARDSHGIADVLEVYQLCLLLGFRGRYGVGGQAELRSVIESVAGKIRRTRGVPKDLSPNWAIPAGQVRLAQSDPWIRRLLFAALGCLILALALFVGFKISLASGASDVSAVAAQGRG
jgi:type VI secretion system protein ImpK